MNFLLLPLINPNLVEQRRKEIGHIIFVTFLKLCDPAPALIIFLGQEIIYAWARNAPKLELPPAVGFKVGGPRSDVKFLVLQVLLDAGVIFCHKLIFVRICQLSMIDETNR